MRITDAYRELLDLDVPVLSTREAAARWRTQERSTTKRLRNLERAGLVRHLRRGLWALEPGVDPFVLPPYLTAPYPAYVSFWSILARAGIIEQIPRTIWVASLDRPRQITTAVGHYEVHRIAPELFTGFHGSDARGYLASPEKALFDLVYIRAAAASRAHFPELSLPADFKRARLKRWTALIESPRLRTLVSRRLREVLALAATEADPTLR